MFGFGLGVTLPVAIGAITKGVGLLRSNTKKGLEYMRRELGDEAVNAMIKEAEETGRPIIEVANDKALKLGQAARMQTPEAMDTIDVAAERFKNTATDRNSAFIDDNLGSLSRFDSIEAMENEAREKAKPYYDRLQNVDDLAEVEAKNLATRERLINSQAESMFNPNKYTKQQAENVLRDRAENLKMKIFNDGLDGERQGVNHFLGTDRRPYIRSIEQTVSNPDVSFTWDGKPHFSKKYTDGNSGKDFMDLVITKDGKLFNKFPTDEAFVANKTKGAQDLSFKAPSSDTFKPISGVSDNNNIPSLATYVKENPFLQQEIGKIRKNPLFQTEYKMSELPDTDWRILDQVNKNINDQIATAVRNGENETVRLLERQKYDLLNKVDEIVPEYKEARALYEDARRFKKAANTAEQIFKRDISKEAFAKTFDDMSKTEREALKIGMRDEIYKIIGNLENEALGWKKIVPAQVQDKIRKVLGVDKCVFLTITK